MCGGCRIGCEAWCGGYHLGKLALSLGSYGADYHYHQSNHGGRQLNLCVKLYMYVDQNQADVAIPYSSPAPIDILWEIRQQKPDLFNKMEIYVDGGVKHGTDVVSTLPRSSAHLR
jgi:hypothetical protein